MNGMTLKWIRKYKTLNKHNKRIKFNKCNRLIRRTFFIFECKDCNKQNKCIVCNEFNDIIMYEMNETDKPSKEQIKPAKLKKMNYSSKTLIIFHNAKLERLMKNMNYLGLF